MAEGGRKIFTDGYSSFIPLKLLQFSCSQQLLVTILRCHFPSCKFPVVDYGSSKSRWQVLKSWFSFVLQQSNQHPLAAKCCREKIISLHTVSAIASWSEALSESIQSLIEGMKLKDNLFSNQSYKALMNFLTVLQNKQTKKHQKHPPPLPNTAN